jgi:hypothetical protein
VAKNDEHLRLQINIETEAKKSIETVRGLERQFGKLIKAPVKLTEISKKGLSDFNKSLNSGTRNVLKMRSALQAAAKTSFGGKASVKQLKQLEGAFEGVYQTAQKLQRETSAQQRKIDQAERKLAKAKTEDEKKAAKKSLRDTKKKAEEELKILRTQFNTRRKLLDEGFKSTGAAKSLANLDKLTRKQAEIYKEVLEDASKAGATLEQSAQVAKAHTEAFAAAFQRASSAGQSFEASMFEAGKHVEKYKESFDDLVKSSDGFKYGFRNLANDFGTDLANGVEEAIDGLKNKDFAGVAKGLGSGLLKSLKSGKVGMEKFAMANKGAGGMKGMAANGMGAALKGISGVASKLGPVLNTFAKMGPMIGAVSGAVIGLIKLLIDVESHAKELNKEILDGASTADLYAASANNFDAGLGKLKGTLRTVRDEMSDFKMNDSMGTNAKDHLQVLGVLQKEGQTLKTLEDRLSNNKKQADALHQSMTKFSDVTKMSIAYSRLFGVSIDEIASFQSEMMTELGTSLVDTKLEFARMESAAVESGIAANKFFNIMRNVSSDLSLYGVRLGEVTKMLKQMGKAMSPRTAQKYLQSFAKGMKDFSADDRLKMVLLGGPGAVNDIKKDLAGQKDDIVKKLAKEAGVDESEAKSLLEGKRGAKSGKTLTELSNSGAVKDVGTLREGYKNAKRGERQLASGGLYGAAMASKDLSGFGSYKFKKAAALRLSGSSSLEGAIGLHGEKAAQVAGLDGEKFEELIGIERAIKQQQEDLTNAVDDPGANPEMINKLKEMIKGFENMDAAAQKNAIKQLSEEQVWKSIDQKEGEKELSQADRMEKLAEAQGKETVNILDRLQTLIDYIYNYIYGVLEDIYDFLVHIPAFSSAESRQKAEAMRSAKGDLAVTGALTGSKSDEMANNVAKVYQGRLSGKLGADGADVKGAAGTMLGGGLTKDQVSRAAEMAGIKLDNIEGFRSGDRDTGASGSASYDADGAKAVGKDMQAALIAGLDPDQLKTLMDKMFLTMNVQQQVEAGKKLGLTQDSKGQQEASKKAAAPEAAAAVSSSGPAAPATTPAPASTPSSPASSSATDPQAAKAADARGAEAAKQADTLIKGQDELHNDMRQKGIKIDKPFLEGPFQKAIKDGVLDAARKALFEFALYSSEKPDELLGRMEKSGFEQVVSLAKSFRDEKKYDAGFLQPTEHAEGGRVVGVTDTGMAIFQAPRGEGLTSIGPGEEIMTAQESHALRAGAGGGKPAPAGGGTVNAPITINVNGLGAEGLAKHLEREVPGIIYRYQKAAKLQLCRTSDQRIPTFRDGSPTIRRTCMVPTLARGTSRWSFRSRAPSTREPVFCPMLWWRTSTRCRSERPLPRRSSASRRAGASSSSTGATTSVRSRPTALPGRLSTSMRVCRASPGSGRSRGTATGTCTTSSRTTVRSTTLTATSSFRAT